MDSASQTSASKYIGRWNHRLTLRFRVWPKFKETHAAIARAKTIPVNGIRITDDGRAEIWNQTSAGICGAVFEMDDDDFDVLTAIPKAGARMSMRRRMVVHAPGTTDERVKKECWLEVPVFAYPEASERKIPACGSGRTNLSPHEVFGETPEDALGLVGASYGKIVFIESDEDVDEDLICREVVENDAVIVLNHRPAAGSRGGVSTAMGRRLMSKAVFWTVPGREPWEDGGALRGYQFSDRIVRWTRRFDKGNRAENNAQRLARMHDSVRDKGRSARRRFFLESSVARLAKRVGVSRQRVMSRFLDEGVVDWLIRSVDNVKPIRNRETAAFLRGRVGDAVKALEFYYRAIEAMRREEGNGERGTGNGEGEMPPAQSAENGEYDDKGTARETARTPKQEALEAERLARVAFKAKARELHLPLQKARWTPEHRKVWEKAMRREAKEKAELERAKRREERRVRQAAKAERQKALAEKRQAIREKYGFTLGKTPVTPEEVEGFKRWQRDQEAAYRKRHHDSIAAYNREYRRRKRAEAFAKQREAWTPEQLAAWKMREETKTFPLGSPQWMVREVVKHIAGEQNLSEDLVMGRIIEFGGLDFIVKGAESMGRLRCSRQAIVVAAAHALALYIDPDNAAMFGCVGKRGEANA